LFAEKRKQKEGGPYIVHRFAGRSNIPTAQHAEGRQLAALQRHVLSAWAVGGERKKQLGW